MEKYTKQKQANLHSILFFLLIGEKARTICKKNYDLKKYPAIYKSYKNLQKKVFDKFLLFNIPLSDNLISNKKINKKYVCVLYEYVLDKKSIKEIHNCLIENGITISLFALYYQIKIAKSMIGNYCYINRDKYEKYINKKIALGEITKPTFSNQKSLQSKENKNDNISSESPIDKNIYEDNNDKVIKTHQEPITENNNIKTEETIVDAEEQSSTMSFAERLEQEQKKERELQEKRLKEEQEKKQKEELERQKEEAKYALYDKNEVIGDSEYFKIVFNELEEIASDPKRLPLYPSDHAHPYKKDLWYKYEDFPPKEEWERYSLEEYFVMKPQKDEKLRWDEEHPFFFLSIFGTIKKWEYENYQEDKMPYYEYSYCREAKKGSATRGYISHVVRDVVDKLHRLTNKSKRELNYEVDDILREWEYPKEMVETVFSTGLLTAFSYPVKEFKSQEEEDKIPDDEFKEYWDTVHPDAYKKIKAEGNIEKIEYLAKRLKYTMFDIENANDIKAEFAGEWGRNSTNYGNKQNENYNDVIKYNNAIAESKLEFLFEKLNKRYSKYETSFNIDDSKKLLKSIKNINEIKTN